MPCKLFSPSFSFVIPFINAIQPFYGCKRNARKNITVTVSVRVSVTVRVSLVWRHRHFLFRKISKWHGFSAKRDSAKWGITVSTVSSAGHGRNQRAVVGKVRWRQPVQIWYQTTGDVTAMRISMAIVKILTRQECLYTQYKQGVALTGRNTTGPPSYAAPWWVT